MHHKVFFFIMICIFVAFSVNAASAQAIQQFSESMRFSSPIIAQTNNTTVRKAPRPSAEPSQNLHLRSLMQEHAMLASNTLIARFDNHPQFEAAQEALQKNSQLISQEIGKRYGSETQQRFLTLWNRHNEAYIQYADGLKENITTKDNAKNQLDSLINELASTFENHTSADRVTLVDLFKNHVYFTRQVLEMHAAGNYRMRFEYDHVSFEHAATMSEALSS